MYNFFCSHSFCIIKTLLEVCQGALSNIKTVGFSIVKATSSTHSIMKSLLIFCGVVYAFNFPERLSSPNTLVTLPFALRIVRVSPIGYHPYGIDGVKLKPHSSVKNKSILPSFSSVINSIKRSFF
jgi:hypothetical protein